MSAPAVPSLPGGSGAHPVSGWRSWLLFAAVLLCVYGPALRGDFLWDDRPGHVTRPELQSIDGLRRIWFEIGATQQYYPVLHTAFWLEHRAWGDAPLGYHLTNVLLHATAAALFMALLRRLAVPGAWLAAGVFALHPVAVESVAWISEQKNTLSAVWYLAAALAYWRFEDDRTVQRYVVATACFVLALLTKSVTASLPAAWLVLAWWRRGRISWRDDVSPLVPWFALGLVGGLLTAWFEHELIGARGAEFARSALERGLLPGGVVLFYLGKLLWPANLAFIYPRWDVRTDDWQWYVWLALVAAALIAGWWRRERARGPLAVALLYGGTLFPVLGWLNVFPFRYSFVADHFQYLASLAPIAGAAALLATQLRSPRVFVPAAGCALLALALLSWSQSAAYRDSFTLYETTLARNPNSWMAHTNLAEALTAAGRPAEAVPHLECALRLKPDSAEAENNLGDNLRRLNRPLDAIPHLRRALELQPNYPEARNNLGVALMAAGDRPGGKAELELALRLRPAFALAHYNLGLAHANSGEVPAAAKEFAAAVAAQPDYAEAEVNWGIALLLSQNFGAAAPHFQRALQLSPNSPTAHHSYGRALAFASRWEEAIAEYRAALQLDPAFVDAHLSLAEALRKIGRDDEAARHAAEASRLRGR